jgi:putative Holliday junction resolvase
MAETAGDAGPAGRPGRVLGLDLGERRIGVALSDSERRLAVPHSVLERSGDLPTDRARLVELAAELGVTAVVVGMPVSLAGGTGPAARAAQAEVEALRERLDVPVATVDERLTTVEVQRRLREITGERDASRRGGRGGRAGRAAGRARPERAVVDDAAAAVLLQAWLDAGAGRQ